MNPPTHVRHWLERIESRLDERAQAALLREMPVLPRDEANACHGSRLICVCDNDYLRLRSHPHLIDAVREAAKKWGVGSGSSRLVAGSSPAHLDLEERFARFKQAEAALLFPTGYMANLAVLSTLAQRSDLVVLDKHSHASLIDGARLAAAQGATLRTFPHGRLDRLAALLNEHRADKPGAARFIVTDTVFSMDGDVADLTALAALRDEYDAALILDEAHATGVLGPGGEGADVQGVADITISTASKALGSLGGIVSGPRLFIDWLVNAARPFIYTTAAAPTQAAAIDAALDLIESEPQRRQRLVEIGAAVRAGLSRLGLPVRDDPTPIVPIVVGSARRAIALAEHLRANGIAAPAIRPPTVGLNAARVRLSLHCDLTGEEIERICAAVVSFVHAGWD